MVTVYIHCSSVLTLGSKRIQSHICKINRQEIPLTLTVNLQLEVSPAESVTYVISVRPASNCCGVHNPVAFKVSLELSVGTGMAQFTVA